MAPVRDETSTMSADLGGSLDTAAIGRLADELVPALSAALGATGLAEIEIRRPGWRVRVRRDAASSSRPDDDPAPHRRRAPDRAARASAGHSADGREHDATNGSGPEPVREPGRASRGPATPSTDRFRAVATSPAVGPFRLGRDIRSGVRVRAGDRLGMVDVLGVPQEVSAPVDGIVMAVLVDADDAVEYGQPLVELEKASSGPGAGAVDQATTTSGSTSAGAGEG